MILAKLPKATQIESDRVEVSLIPQPQISITIYPASSTGIVNNNMAILEGS